jgi:flagellar biosynthesis/type III secretory pathway protein FliH
MNALSSVLFIEDFDERPRAPAIEAPEIIAPGYAAEDIEAAREEGRLAALDDHAALHTSLCTAALTAIADHIESARTAMQDAAARNADDIANAMLALLKTTLPATAARVATAEVQALTAMLLPPLARQPGVELRVHPTVHPFISTTLCEKVANLPDVTIHSDASLAPSDVTLTWHDGMAKRDWAALWKQVSEALSPFSLPDDLHMLMTGPGEHHGD